MAQNNKPARAALNWYEGTGHEFEVVTQFGSVYSYAEFALIELRDLPEGRRFELWTNLGKKIPGIYESKQAALDYARDLNA